MFIRLPNYFLGLIWRASYLEKGQDREQEIEVHDRAQTSQTLGEEQLQTAIASRIGNHYCDLQDRSLSRKNRFSERSMDERHWWRWEDVTCSNYIPEVLAGTNTTNGPVSSGAGKYAQEDV